MSDQRPPTTGDAVIHTRTRRLASTVLAAVVIAFAGTTASACGGQSPPPASPPPAAPATSTITPAPIPSPSDVPDIPPERRDGAFAQALESKNLQTGDTDSRTQVATRVCQALDANTTLNDLASQLQNELGGPTPEDTGFIIGAATAIYCPNDLPKLKQN